MGRLWFESHNLPYSLYLFEETLFTPLSQGQFAIAKRLVLHMAGQLGSSDYCSLFWASAIVSWRKRSMNSTWSGRSLCFCTTNTGWA